MAAIPAISSELNGPFEGKARGLTVVQSLFG